MDWPPIYKQLQIALRKACSVLAEERQLSYKASAVEQEVEHGLFSESADTMKERCFFINRSIPVSIV